MAPSDIEVRISSEMSDWTASSAVRRERMPVAQLVERMLGVTGKDAARVGELLRRGSLLSGGARHRWEGFVLDEMEIATLLDSFPDSDASRQFSAARCRLVVLHGGADRLEMDRGSALKRRLLRRDDFWSLLMRIAGANQPEYRSYHYRERADLFRLPLQAADVERLREGAALLGYSAWEAKVQRMKLETLDLFVLR